jgi:hypothetical protein
MLAEYSGREDELFAKLCAKYNVADDSIMGSPSGRAVSPRSPPRYCVVYPQYYPY